MSNDKNAQWHGGKGSYRRAENKEAYESNWDKIFGKKETQPVEESETDRFLRHMESIKRLQDAK